jgi:hypothetical protein
MDYNLNTSVQKPITTVSGTKTGPLQITKAPAANPTGQPTTAAPTSIPKKNIFAVKKEDPALLDKMNSDEKGMPGTFAGISSFIDGYLRINKRRYGARR